MISRGVGRNSDLVKYKKPHRAEIKRLHLKPPADQCENKGKDRNKTYEQEKAPAKKTGGDQWENRNRPNRKGS